MLVALIFMFFMASLSAVIVILALASWMAQEKYPLPVPLSVIPIGVLAGWIISPWVRSNLPTMNYQLLIPVGLLVLFAVLVYVLSHKKSESAPVGLKPVENAPEKHEDKPESKGEDKKPEEKHDEVKKDHEDHGKDVGSDKSKEHTDEDCHKKG